MTLGGLGEGRQVGSRCVLSNITPEGGPAIFEAHLSRRRRRPLRGYSCASSSLCVGSSTGRTRAPSSSRHPGQWALSPARTGRFLEPTWPSRSPAACTPRWRRWCPIRRHTRCPTSPGIGSPRGPHTGHLRSRASEPNPMACLCLLGGTRTPPWCVS